MKFHGPFAILLTSYRYYELFLSDNFTELDGDSPWCWFRNIQTYQDYEN